MTLNKALLISAFCLLLTGTNAMAAKYRFEVILFEYTDPQQTESETWPPQPGNPNFGNVLVNIYNNSYKSGRANKAGYAHYMLKPSQLILKKEANAIKRSSSRRLLLHTAWVQSMHSSKKARPVAIRVGKLYNTLLSDSAALYDNYNIPSGSPVKRRQLEGTIKISLSRYLHVWTDLVFRRPHENVYANTAGTNLQSFRYRDHRRMRSKELHYIDNPSFGMLIYALPIK